MAGDAQNFHVAFLRTHALGGPQGNHRAVFVLHAVANVAVGEEVEEVILVGGERPKVGELRTREGHVIRHKPGRVFGQGVMHPNVDVKVLFAVAVVPKFGRSHPRAVHQVLHIAGVHGGHAVAFLPGHGHGQRPTRLGGGVERQVCEGHFGPEVLPLQVVHEAVHGVHVEQVVFDAGRTGIQDVRVKHPLHLPYAVGDAPRMQVLFGQAHALSLTVDAFDPQDVLREVAQLVTARSPGRQLQGPSAFAFGEHGAEVNALRGLIALQFVAYSRCAHFNPFRRSAIGWPVVPLG